MYKCVFLSILFFNSFKWEWMRAHGTVMKNAGALGTLIPVYTHLDQSKHLIHFCFLIKFILRFMKKPCLYLCKIDLWEGENFIFFLNWIAQRKFKSQIKHEGKIKLEEGWWSHVANIRDVLAYSREAKPERHRLNSRSGHLIPRSINTEEDERYHSSFTDQFLAATLQDK